MKFKYYIEFCGEITLFRSHAEFNLVKHRLINNRLRDLKKISNGLPEVVNRAYAVNESAFYDGDNNIFEYVDLSTVRSLQNAKSSNVINGRSS